MSRYIAHIHHGARPVSQYCKSHLCIRILLRRARHCVFELSFYRLMFSFHILFPYFILTSIILPLDLNFLASYSLHHFQSSTSILEDIILEVAEGRKLHTSRFVDKELLVWLQNLLYTVRCRLHICKVVIYPLVRDRQLWLSPGLRYCLLLGFSRGTGLPYFTAVLERVPPQMCCRTDGQAVVGVAQQIVCLFQTHLLVAFGRCCCCLEPLVSLDQTRK